MLEEIKALVSSISVSCARGKPALRFFRSLLLLLTQRCNNKFKMPYIQSHDEFFVLFLLSGASFVLKYHFTELLRPTQINSLMYFKSLNYRLHVAWRINLPCMQVVYFSDLKYIPVSRKNTAARNKIFSIKHFRFRRKSKISCQFLLKRRKNQCVFPPKLNV